MLVHLMRYTQSQIRDLLSISLDSVRAWRSAIPALAIHKGHTPSFTPGDVVAMAIVAELVRDFGVRVGSVGARFDELFQACQGQSWPSLETCVAVIEAEKFFLIEAEAFVRRPCSTSIICVPCRPIITRLRLALAANEPDPTQCNLPFPPTAVAMKPERREKRL
jgi:hypothetical protein